jgi:hypothetical protein
MKIKEEELNYLHKIKEEEKRLLASFSDALSNRSKAMKSLVAHLYLNHKAHFLDVYPDLNDFHNEIGTVDNSTGKPDCWLLYLLTLEFKPEIIFEAGTYIGTTTKIMAEACSTYGGKVYTCDPVDTYIPSERHDKFIKTHNMGAIGLINQLKDEGKEIDFAFFDCDLPNTQVDALLGIAKDDFAFVAHDFYDADGTLSKGARNLIFAWRILESRGYQLFIPSLKDLRMGNNNVRLSNKCRIFTAIGQSAAALLPPSFKITLQ